MIELYWDNDEQTVLLCEFHAGWTWDEMYKTLDAIKKITDSTDYEIAAIVDIQEGVGIPGGSIFNKRTFEHAKKMLQMGEGGTGPLVIVGANPLIRMVHETFKTLDRNIANSVNFAKTLDEARDILARIHVPASPLAVQQARA
ncbi:MAG: hypothetical protein SGI73_05970 [Chloroflexota bacterium]|nr:hypothetical protein [Chloroflexota bacterium]